MFYDLSDNRFKDYEYLKERIARTNIDDWDSVNSMMDDICQIIVGPVWRGDTFVFPTNQIDFHFNTAVRDLIASHGTLMQLLRGCFMRDFAYDPSKPGRVCLNAYALHMISFLSARPDPRYFSEVQTNS